MFPSSLGFFRNDFMKYNSKLECCQTPTLMPHLFVAIDLPDAAKDQILSQHVHDRPLVPTGSIASDAALHRKCAGGGGARLSTRLGRG